MNWKVGGRLFGKPRRTWKDKVVESLCCKVLDFWESERNARQKASWSKVVIGRNYLGE